MKWTLAAGNNGIPREISINPFSVPGKANFRLEIDGTEVWKDKFIASPLSIPLIGGEISTNITIQILSTDGTTIAADGSISGGEY